MHQRYGFELIENEPDLKAFCTQSVSIDPNEECWVILSHDKEELTMTFVIDTHLDYCNEDTWYKNIWEKLKLCYNIITNKKVRCDSEFTFRGRNHVEDFADMITLLGKEVKKETNELIELREQNRRLNKDKGV